MSDIIESLEVEESSLEVVATGKSAAADRINSKGM